MIALKYITLFFALLVTIQIIVRLGVVMAGRNGRDIHSLHLMWAAFTWTVFIYLAHE
jgi:hypothetical protein